VISVFANRAKEMTAAQGVATVLRDCVIFFSQKWY